MLNTFPSGKSYPSARDDRFYAAAIDLDMPLTVHVSMQFPDGFLLSTQKLPASLRSAATRSAC
jgi:hypothetical protein